MLVGNLEIKVGDVVWAHRPLYNKSDEVVPLTKKTRPYVVLKCCDNGDFLVVCLTSNYKYESNIWVVDKSFARTNDLYLLKKPDIINVVRSIDNEAVDNLFKECFNCIEHNSILYSEAIKKIFLDEYYNRFPNRQLEYFNPCTIIALPTNLEKKYIIDAVSNDKYAVYRVNIDSNMNVSIDFSSCLTFEKEVCYQKVSVMNSYEYLYKKNQYLDAKHISLMSQNRKISRELFTGSLVKYDNVVYFVICVSAKRSSLICIQYNADYMLDKIEYFDKNKIKKVSKIGELCDSETLTILKSVYNNLKISNNTELKDKIYAKIMQFE